MMCIITAIEVFVIISCVHHILTSRVWGGIVMYVLVRVHNYLLVKNTNYEVLRKDTNYSIEYTSKNVIYALEYLNKKLQKSAWQVANKEL